LGVWYKIVGDGSCFMVVAEALSAVVLAVLQGFDCSALACVSEVSGLSATVEFKAFAEQTYYVVVAGASNDDLSSFQITVEVSA